MTIYPDAVFKPTPYGGRTPRNRQGRGILHVGVSRARSLPPWNQNTWHFWVALDGYCEQYVDTDFRAYASGDANDDAVQIETAGGTGSSRELNAEEWTPAQAARIADIMRWEASQPSGAPLDLLPDSKPGRRGWGPHRLGIQHSGGVGAVPGWLVAGGERWSSVLGKECPGDAKIRQIPQLIEMARSGQMEDDMPYGANEADLTWRKPQATAGYDGSAAPIVLLEHTRTDVAVIKGQMAGLTAAVNTMADAIASGRDDLTAEELRQVIREEMANVVDVQVTVRDGSDSAA